MFKCKFPSNLLEWGWWEGAGREDLFCLSLACFLKAPLYKSVFTSAPKQRGGSEPVSFPRVESELEKLRMEGVGKARLIKG